MVMPTPEASSIAPVPRSQESRCEAITTNSSPPPLPVISPITLCEVYSPSKPTSRDSCTVTAPRSSSRLSWSASGSDSAAAGIGSTPSAKRVMPVLATRAWLVPSERIRKPTAPLLLATAGPRPRVAPAAP